MRSSRRGLFGVIAAGAAGVAGIFLPLREVARAEERAIPGLVGAWLVSAIRPTGIGVAMFTFTSDGTFFRSGDTHPVLGVAHGVWTQLTETVFDAIYIGLRFDTNRDHIGSQRTLIRINLGQGQDADEFTGQGKVSILALDGSVQSRFEAQLQGKRIVVESFGSFRR